MPASFMKISESWNGTSDSTSKKASKAETGLRA
jgi:hypothetical protein